MCVFPTMLQPTEAGRHHCSSYASNQGQQHLVPVLPNHTDAHLGKNYNEECSAHPKSPPSLVRAGQRVPRMTYLFSVPVLDDIFLKGFVQI